MKCVAVKCQCWFFSETNRAATSPTLDKCWTRWGTTMSPTMTWKTSKTFVIWLGKGQLSLHQLVSTHQKWSGKSWFCLDHFIGFSQDGTESTTSIVSGIATLLNRINKNSVTVAVDGSLYRFHPLFHDLMMQKITELLNPGLKVSFGVLLRWVGCARLVICANRFLIVHSWCSDGWFRLWTAFRDLWFKTGGWITKAVVRMSFSCMCPRSVLKHTGLSLTTCSQFKNCSIEKLNDFVVLQHFVVLCLPQKAPESKLRVLLDQKSVNLRTLVFECGCVCVILSTLSHKKFCLLLERYNWPPDIRAHAL